MRIANQANVNNMMQRYFNNTNAASAQSIKRIATGYRINSAADDASGLAISRRMAAQLSGIDTASRNVQDGISMLQTADGALGQAGDITTRMQELAVKAGNGILSGDDRQIIQEEFNQLSAQLDQIGSSTTFNGNQLLDGSAFSILAGGESEDATTLQMGTVSSAALGLDKVSLGSTAGALKALDAIKNAGANLSAQRASVGASQNGLTSSYDSLTDSAEKLSESLSKLADTNIAKESTEKSLSDVLHRTSIAMMSNAQYVIPYNAMQLLLE